MCYLLNKLPDVVALHEPMRVKEFRRYRNQDAICREIDLFFANTRSTLAQSGLAVSKKVGDSVPDNHISDDIGSDGLRINLVDRGAVRFEVPMDQNYTLAIKHIVAFTALLEQLVGRYDVYASVRNPLAVLLSWNSVDMAVREGRAPVAERLDEHLKGRLAGIADRFVRQVELLGWFFAQFDKYLPRSNIIRYETVMATGGACLDVIVPSARQLSERLESRNHSGLYDRNLIPVLTETMFETNGDYLKFYSRGDIEELAEELTSPAKGG